MFQKRALSKEAFTWFDVWRGGGGVWGGVEGMQSKNSLVKIDPDVRPRGPDPSLGQFDPEFVSM